MSKQANIETCLITCPNCQAQYKVGVETLGTAGRVVKCAQCDQAWKALAESPNVDVAEAEEQAMDAAFEKAAPSGTAKPVAEGADAEVEGNAKGGSSAKGSGPRKMTAQEKRDENRRKHLLNRTMPKTKISKYGRLASGILLVTILIGLIVFRQNVVKSFPDMAGVYGNIGLGVNVVGLEFADVKTLRILRDGDEVLEISAGVKSVSSHQVSVPKILVTLLDETGRSVYEWSVTSRAAIMLPGEWIAFETRLISPPKEAVSVRLAFEE